MERVGGQDTSTDREKNLPKQTLEEWPIREPGEHENREDVFIWDLKEMLKGFQWSIEVEGRKKFFTGHGS